MSQKPTSATTVVTAGSKRALGRRKSPTLRNAISARYRRKPSTFRQPAVIPSFALPPTTASRRSRPLPNPQILKLALYPLDRQAVNTRLLPPMPRAAIKRDREMRLAPVRKTVREILPKLIPTPTTMPANCSRTRRHRQTRVMRQRTRNISNNRTS